MHAMQGIRQQYGENFWRIFQTITSDNSSEFIDFLFLMLRKFVPKGKSIHNFTDEQIRMFVDKIYVTHTTQAPWLPRARGAI